MDSIKKILIIGLLILVILATIGVSTRIIAYKKLRYTTEKNNVVTVATIQAEPSSAMEEIVLPGNIEGWHATNIFARTNGYTVNWKVDIGAHVKEGDLLATITTPELDEQLRQAEANLVTAEANNALAQRTAARWVYLWKTHSVSKQETDVQVSAAKANTAIVAAARANRDRLRKLVRFERVVAPFTGIIMSRTVDIGRLINAGSSSSSLPLFRIVQTDPLRIYVRVPQYYSARVQQNLTVDLYFREHPQKIYAAQLLNTAEAIDAETRTLLVQFKINNPNNELLPGAYTEVHIRLPGSATNVRIPVNTLIFRAQGMQVASIDNSNAVVFKSITIDRDFGSEVEVAAGLTPGETVILNPPSTLVAGQKVRVAS